MLTLGGLAFTSPWLLTALIALPALWFLLRVTPPSPRFVSFPPMRLLLALRPNEETPARTPWWLILLRMFLAALVILALSHPLLNPATALRGSGPMVLVIDDDWASAANWLRSAIFCAPTMPAGSRPVFGPNRGRRIARRR